MAEKSIIGWCLAESQAQQTQCDDNQQSPVQTRSRIGTTICKLTFEREMWTMWIDMHTLCNYTCMHMPYMNYTGVNNKTLSMGASG